jgi:hypothetical protein
MANKFKRGGWCGSPDHLVAGGGLNRRAFLGAAASGAAALAADMTALNCLKTPALASQVKRQDKRVIWIWLAGGASQLETWDPKPGRPTGGPFRAIPTSVPGVHISELMPKLAQRMKHTAVIRSLNTRNGDHGGGAALMETGRGREAGLEYPDLGAMLARELGRADSQVPDYVSMYTSTEGRRKGTSGFLGARYAPLFLEKEGLPDNMRRLDSITDLDHQQRAELRDLLSRRFAQSWRDDVVASHNGAYGRVRGLMASEQLFDLSREPRKTRDQYGPTQFGEQILIARRLVEAGVPFVKIARAWWDSHGQNFETHLELVSELDHVLSALLDDLQDRGLLEHTLICCFGEFGRTPTINPSLGRDHFATAWSASLHGCGINGGSVYGETDPDGRTVVKGQVGAKDLFATIFKAVGIDPHHEYYLGDRPIPVTDPGSKAIAEVLA